MVTAHPDIDANPRMTSSRRLAVASDLRYL
jgi:hypothetical protein